MAAFGCSQFGRLTSYCAMYYIVKHWVVAYWAKKILVRRIQGPLATVAVSHHHASPRLQHPITIAFLYTSNLLANVLPLPSVTYCVSTMSPSQ